MKQVAINRLVLSTILQLRLAPMRSRTNSFSLDWRTSQLESHLISQGDRTEGKSTRRIMQARESVLSLGCLRVKATYKIEFWKELNDLQMLIGHRIARHYWIRKGSCIQLIPRALCLPSKRLPRPKRKKMSSLILLNRWEQCWVC